MSQTSDKRRSYHIIAILIIAGETIFLLPFVLPRLFRPTYLDLFEITNLELGTCFSLYGLVALISYFFGGLIADRFQPRKLMALALLMTAAGGWAMAAYPSLLVMHIIYGYWGFTTILLFWAAMIKATRAWGGLSRQGRAFGLLDGGRGLVAAVIGSAGVMVFSFFLTGEVEAASVPERKEAFSKVLLFTSGLVVVVALVVWMWLKPDPSEVHSLDGPVRRQSLNSIRTVLKIRSVWLLMLIILSGYVGYKLTDDFTLYAREVMLYDEIASAEIGSWLFYLRPVAGITFGFMADRSRSSTWILVGFALMLAGSLVFASGLLAPGMYLVFFLSLIATSIGIYAVRALYFAALQEGRIPLALTGTAVGVISLVGYTPDIFVGPIMGYLLDSSPGETGHRHVFMLLAGFSTLGLAAIVLFKKHNSKA